MIVALIDEALTARGCIQEEREWYGTEHKICSSRAAEMGWDTASNEALLQKAKLFGVSGRLPWMDDGLRLENPAYVTPILRQCGEGTVARSAVSAQSGAITACHASSAGTVHILYIRSTPYSGQISTTSPQPEWKPSREDLLLRRIRVDVMLCPHSRPGPRTQPPLCTPRGHELVLCCAPKVTGADKAAYYCLSPIPLSGSQWQISHGSDDTVILDNTNVLLWRRCVR